ncbi:MAG: transcription-repair coupling factor [Pirellulales bacterium]|nr:transcription-repair coupling factor [Pirellulales bacterium]
MSVTTPATTAGERIASLAGRLVERSDFAQVVAACESHDRAELDGVWGSVCALAASALATRSNGTLLVVAAHQEDVEKLAEDLRLFTSVRVEQFPALESEPDERSIHDELVGDRLRVLKQLVAGDAPDILVASIQSLMQPVPSPTDIKANSRRLAIGTQLDPEDFCRWLAEQSFHNATAVELPGEFSRRGGIVDVFVPDWEQPVRIEWFGDEIDSLRVFEVAGQRSLGAVDEVEITFLGADHLTGSDEEEPSHLAEYLPESSWLMLFEPETISGEAHRCRELQENTAWLHDFSAVMRSLKDLGTCAASQVGQGGENSCRVPVESIERFGSATEKTDFAALRDQLDAAAGEHDVIVVCQTDAEAERLGHLFADCRLAQDGRLDFVVGALSSGFRLLPEGLVLISGSELFHRTDLRRSSRRRLGRAIDSFLDLRTGDFVVHLSHGIARYNGMKVLERESLVEEHLELEFDGGTKIFVPSSRIDLVQKYVGGGRARPRLAKVGGRLWQRQKTAAEEAADDLASELLELQASREALPGIAAQPDSLWQREFDASFPYEETPDQLAAIGEIKTDMHMTRPMDRLLCGDVGFGKTEMAMRAAFKMVDNGYQVAMLVPTTVLCEQHYRSFRERMAEYPIEVAKLSRFCKPKEERLALEGIASGAVDIVIGTHRLASFDVQFHNLGMVIIDEEQRFGVEVKERLKHLRKMVEVLTLTATPIPRTLHMSLLGLRDISSLETPPDERMAVETQVTRWQDDLIRHAILRELNRNGQVFFVHNRIRDIEIVADRIRNLVPEATLEIGHGKMAEGELERVMVDFVNHKFDILLATTIIESGLDIPNANTMIIDDADRYGLADLHQLRGRVGRYKHRAYCYLLVDPKKNLSPTASKRLRAIEEFSEMGAGFAIAMHDLEIRGAGNILGPQQSGHIAAVGYEMYCDMLEKAVREQRDLPPKVEVDVTIDLPGEALLSDDYIEDLRTKIDLYRRLARITSYDELAQIDAELTDRFGPQPATAEMLVQLARLRLWAHSWSIRSISMEGDYVVLLYADTARIRSLEKLANQGRGVLRIVDERSAYVPVKDAEGDAAEILAVVESLLRPE